MQAERVRVIAASAQPAGRRPSPETRETACRRSWPFRGPAGKLAVKGVTRLHRVDESNSVDESSMHGMRDARKRGGERRGEAARPGPRRTNRAAKTSEAKSEERCP